MRGSKRNATAEKSMMEDRVHTSEVLIPSLGRVRFIELHRPEKRNCLSLDMLGDLLLALQGSEGSSLVVLTGAGSSFCAGLDLGEIGYPDATAVSARAHLERLAAIYSWLLDAAIPSLVFAKGYAAGGGAGLVASASQVVVSEDFRFKLPAGNLAALASIAVPVLDLRAGELAGEDWLGREIPANEARAMGLVDSVISKGAWEQCLGELRRGSFPCGIELNPRVQRLKLRETLESLKRFVVGLPH